MKSAKDMSTVTVQNCATCRIILRILKCIFAHVYQRLYFAQIKYSFHKTYGDGKMLKNMKKNIN
jgi:hypothetical protein